MSSGLVIAVVLALLLVATVATRYIRRARRHLDLEAISGGEMPELADRQPAEQVQADEVVLVPLPNRQNQGLLLGSEPSLELFDRSGLTGRDRDKSRGPLPQLVRQIIGSGGMEATRRGQTGIDSGRIVALAPETVEHLKRGTPVYDKAGSMLGLVRGDSGKLKHVMRLDKKGAQAVVASNAATLALTAALSQQLASIEKQLEHISKTLDRFVKDAERHRLARVAGVNRALVKVAQTVSERGRITESDWDVVAPLSESVETNSIEAAVKLDELAQRVKPDLHRGDRHELLQELVEEESLAYWLTVLAESDLALTRWDVLRLYWEQSAEPDSAGRLAERVRQAMEARQRNRHRIAGILQELADPESRTKLDPIRQWARFRLGRQERVVEALLESHGDAFRAPEDDTYAVEPLPQLSA